jgi:RimJ/RimL family protein N-acetyltransferase
MPSVGRYDEIRTERLLLRRWRPEDRPPFAAMNASPVVMEHFHAPLTATQSDAFVDRIEAGFDEHGYGLWAVEVGSELAGFTGICWQTGLPIDPVLEVGWRLAERFWGHGYATEAARAALEVGLEHERVVVSVTAISNERSWRVMERLGLQRSLEFDHPRVPAGHPLQRHYLYRTP